jgi:hypothetical protein
MSQVTLLLFLAVIVILVSALAWVWATEGKYSRSQILQGQGSGNTYEKLAQIIKVWSLSLILVIAVSTGLLPKSILEDFFKNCAVVPNMEQINGLPSGSLNSRNVEQYTSIFSAPTSITTNGLPKNGTTLSDQDRKIICKQELGSRKYELVETELRHIAQNMPLNLIKN